MLFLRFAAHCISLLCLCRSLLGLAPPILSMLCLCSSGQRHAIPLHCRQSRASPLPRCSKLCNAFADRQDSLPGLACPCMARHCFSFAIPRLAFASLLYASPRISFAFPFPRSALLFLCFSMQRYSLPINSFAGRFTAMMFRCSSIRFPAVPILCRSTLGYALPLLCCPAHCLAILCFALARLIRRLRPRGSGPCRSYATDQGHGNIRSPATRAPASGPFRPYR